MRSSLLKSGISRVLSAGLLLGFVACGSTDEPSSQNAAVTEDEQESTLMVPLAKSPSDGGAFNFCTKPAADAPLNLTNAAWMSFFATNEYAMPGDFGPVLTALGFHSPSRPDDQSWATCAADLEQMLEWQEEYDEELSDRHIARDPRNQQAAGKMRTFVTQHADQSDPGVSTAEGIEGFGPCARKWLQGSTAGYPNYQGFSRPAAAFELYLYNTNPAGINNYVQFYSDGKISADATEFEEGSTQVVIARHSELPMAIVSFRGTQPERIKDLLADAAFGQKPLSKFGYSEGWGDGHTGFLANLEVLTESISSRDGTRRPIKLLRQLERWSKEGVTIWVTGHSLGAALGTTLTARMMEFNSTSPSESGPRFRIGGLYTYGSPRVGDDVFAQKFTEMATAQGVPVARFRNDHDLVTDMPGSVGFINDISTKYSHVGTFSFLNEPAVGENGTLKIGKWGEDAGYGVQKSLDDHDSAGYKDRTEAISGYYRQIKAQLDGGEHAAFDKCE